MGAINQSDGPESTFHFSFIEGSVEECLLVKLSGFVTDEESQACLLSCMSFVFSMVLSIKQQVKENIFLKANTAHLAIKVTSYKAPQLAILLPEKEDVSQM